jgi:hypothetical protein
VNPKCQHALEAWQSGIKFGASASHSAGSAEPEPVFAAPVELTEDISGVKAFRHLMLGSEDEPEDAFPTVNEIQSLKTGVIPNQLNAYYAAAQCGDGDGDKDCEKLRDENYLLSFWRPMTAEDVANYAANVKSYNDRLLKALKTRNPRDADTIPLAAPSYLKLLAFMAAGNWPGDLVILRGARRYQAGCVPGGGILDGWNFIYRQRTAMVDAVLIENVSKRPIEIDALLGDRVPQEQLRVLTSGADEVREHKPLDKIAEPLAPGGAILVPTRIVFQARTEDKEEFRKYEQSMEELHQKFGAKGFKGNIESYSRVPQFKDYVYGPEFAIKGAVVNGAPVEFGARHAANAIDLTVSSPVGSCPYLVSFDEKDHEWVEHGKVLHNAPAKDQEYIETRNFEGLRTRFRIEEREPELAHLSQVALVLTLDNGEVLKLSPAYGLRGDHNLAAVELRWGESIEINFALPDNVRAASVVQSRFELAGYYERYSRLQAQLTSENASFGKSPRAPYFDLAADHDDLFNLVCSHPEPAASPASLDAIPVGEVRNWNSRAC